jgi:hypothetical protein
MTAKKKKRQEKRMQNKCVVYMRKVHILEADIVEPYAGFLLTVNRRVRNNSLYLTSHPHRHLLTI